jgi:urease gamma subunit
MFTVQEREKLFVALAAMIARDRRSRGIKLNHPEAQALISSQIVEWAREGRDVADLMQAGATILTTDDVMDGVESLLDQVQVEATFRDGTKLVTVHNPIRHGRPL